MRLHAPNAELPAVLSMAEGYGVTALDKITGQGTLTVDLRAAGPIHSLISGGMARNLNGIVAMNFHESVIAAETSATNKPLSPEYSGWHAALVTAIPGEGFEHSTTTRPGRRALTSPRPRKFRLLRLRVLPQIEAARSSLRISYAQPSCFSARPAFQILVM